MISNSWKCSAGSLLKFGGPQNLRSDNHFNAILVDAGEMASEVDADKNFESIPKHRVRQLVYENQGESIIRCTEKIQNLILFHLVDTAINSLELRFSQLQHHNSYFCFSQHIYELKDVSSSVILVICKDLETILTDGESSDINSLELRNEISVVCSLSGKDLPHLEVLELINKNEFCSKLVLY
ncbi:hypothetical protein AVEN_98245-1 [Araneus ventricosus]|uniref:Uncharacterized protein n=1 Tax=Araneus ventricosus TaxID=182803 RepID=A0A4Y2KT38_ARAVE|nr:hypothetical protein AVEN_98245-1 [Araneus ventricosus]